MPFAYQTRSAKKGAIAKQIIAWQESLEEHWDSLHFGALNINTQDKQHHFELEVYLDNINPNAIQVELYAEGVDDSASVRQIMQCITFPTKSQPDTPSIYRSSVDATRPATDFTPRLVGHFEGVSVPLEESHIRWRG